MSTENNQNPGVNSGSIKNAIKVLTESTGLVVTEFDQEVPRSIGYASQVHGLTVRVFHRERPLDTPPAIPYQVTVWLVANFGSFAKDGGGWLPVYVKFAVIDFIRERNSEWRTWLAGQTEPYDPLKPKVFSYGELIETVSKIKFHHKQFLG